MPPIEINIPGKGIKEILPLEEGGKHAVGNRTISINKITHGRKGLIKRVGLTIDGESQKLLQYNQTKEGWRTDKAAVLLSDQTLVYTRLVSERNRGKRQKSTKNRSRLAQ